MYNLQGMRKSVNTVCAISAPEYSKEYPVAHLHAQFYNLLDMWIN